MNRSAWVWGCLMLLACDTSSTEQRRQAVLDDGGFDDDAAECISETPEENADFSEVDAGVAETEPAPDAAVPTSSESDAAVLTSSESDASESVASESDASEWNADDEDHIGSSQQAILPWLCLGAGGGLLAGSEICDAAKALCFKTCQTKGYRSATFRCVPRRCRCFTGPNQTGNAVDM